MPRFRCLGERVTRRPAFAPAADVRIKSGQASVPRDALSPTPPGPEGSNGNGLLRVQWVSGAWLYSAWSLTGWSSHKTQELVREVRQMGEDRWQICRRYPEPSGQRSRVLIERRGRNPASFAAGIVGPAEGKSGQGAVEIASLDGSAHPRIAVRGFKRRSPWFHSGTSAISVQRLCRAGGFSARVRQPSAAHRVGHCRRGASK
jgi:hypothetical protein